MLLRPINRSLQLDLTDSVHPGVINTGQPQLTTHPSAAPTKGASASMYEDPSQIRVVANGREDYHSLPASAADNNENVPYDETSIHKVRTNL